VAEEWDEEYGQIPQYARGFAIQRVPVSQIASPFINPIRQERIDELAELEDEGHELPPVILDGPGEVEEVDYPEEKYPFLDGHYPVVGEDVWYVHDGHHRVTLAVQRGQRFIDALIIGTSSRMEPNPRYPFASVFEDLLVRFSKGDRPYKLVVEEEVGAGRTIWPVPAKSNSGSPLASVEPSRRSIILDGDLMNPTTVHWLFEFLSRYGQGMLEFELLERDPNPEDWDSPYIDTGYTVRRFLDESKVIHEQSVIRHGRDPGRSHRKDFEYRALKSPQELVWYHATLEKNVPSIMERGLLPSSLKQGRVDGWSPGWNMDLQQGVYLTSSLSLAAQIAETLAIREEQNAVIVKVDGRGLEDTKRLTFDEDALRNSYDGSVQWEGYDADFPQWVTGLESWVKSVAYLGKIAPKYLRVVSTAVYKVVALALPYSKADADPEVDPDQFRFEAEVEWTDVE
jgi:hypothetical protein